MVDLELIAYPNDEHWTGENRKLPERAWINRRDIYRTIRVFLS